MNSFSELVELHEGRKHRLYKDSVGATTGGVGHDFDAKGLSNAAIDFIKAEDMADAAADVEAVFGFTPNPTDARHAALLDMAFELGRTRLSGFVSLRGCWERQDWVGAAAAALDSQWARQVPARAAMDAEMLRTGAWPAIPTS